MTVEICREVLDGILDAARRMYPNEFFCLLGGEKGDVYCVTELVYIPFRSGPTSAIFHVTDIPFDDSIIGSAHSHPGPASPSAADIHSFPYAGWIHLIVGYPYSYETVRVYDARGRELPWRLVDCGQ
ncbi:MAG: peptidase [Candidatus Diapherotrites archaeon]|nr:peptidase [Candidatus Diapherotrites archaeon]